MYNAAAAGEFGMPEGAARRLAQACDTLVAGLRQARVAGAELTEVSGFAELPSGKALARGFGGKGAQYREALTGLQEAALRLKAGYLAAAALFEEADAANRAAMRLAADELDDRL
ncbi:hypothetical protein [Nocardia bovistercoris]|uniref:Uncharacterized protein n=1 Tax=Nocardia bovistercoris TaxID=2785916 RepID=A0A931IC59_9NOCA|nr:hypothetical protein [Nocardia bovistercoris]MBH0777108.1 hypothetical protein [Nocardia bovistercoris]